MEDLIQFRESADALSEDEYELLINSIEKKDVLKALFNFYYKQFEDNDDCTKIKQINNKISEIVHQRSEPDKLTNIKLPSPQLHNITQPLINRISSYLNDLSSFQIACRRIYIASKSPQHLNTVTVSQMKKCVDYCKKHNKLVHLNQFIAAQCLEFDESDPFVHNSWLNRFTMNNLSKIEFLGERGMQILLTLDNIKLQKIKTLGLSSVYDTTCLLDLFQRTPNLEVLGFSSVDIEHLDLSKEITKNIMSQLKGLQFVDTECDDPVSRISDIINLCGNQLQALDLYDLLSFNLNINFKKLYNIIELHLSIFGNTQLKEMIPFINYFKNLQRVHLAIYKITPDFKELFGICLTALFGLDSLEFIEFKICLLSDVDSATNEEVMILRLIEEALMSTTKTRLKMTILMNGIHKDIAFYFSSLVNSLCSEIQDDFMLCVEMAEDRISTEIKENIKNWLDKRKQKLFVDLLSFHSFVVCNKQCKINGYSEKWILSI